MGSQTGGSILNQPSLLIQRIYPEEEWGVEDARIVYLAELEQYAITYTAYSPRGPLVSLALTRDFKSFERRGMIMQPEDKDAAFFSRRIGGKWALIHRPVTPGSTADIHLSFSADLQHWSESSALLASRRGNWWDANKIGLCSPPIETVEGWLLIYHGVRVTGAGVIYRVGLALLDLEDPTRIIRRGDEWVMSPSEPYEIIGDVGYVVFPCGQVVDEVTGEIRLYYGDCRFINCCGKWQHQRNARLADEEVARKKSPLGCFITSFVSFCAIAKRFQLELKTFGNFGCSPGPPRLNEREVCFTMR